MKRKYGIFLGLILLFFGIVGCTTESNNPTPTPTTIIDTMPTTQEKEPTITLEVSKEDKLLEELKKMDISVEGYNSLNRKLSIDVAIGLEGTSDFCMDETTGVVYFVNQGKDDYLYQIREGEVQLAVALPVKQVYHYQGDISFRIGKSEHYDLQEKQSGDIYCYTPESGTIELVYAAGAIEDSKKHKLNIEESGIYFSYTVREGSQGRGFFCYLPFGATEPVQDTKFMTTKGWKDYFFSISSLKSRTPKEDGTRETIKLPVSQTCFCVVGDILYSAERTKISCIDLNTGEQTAYDFLKAIQKMEGKEVVEEEGVQVIQSFTIIEDAVWVTTGGFLYRMDLQSGKVNGVMIKDDKESGNITTLYTDGKELYGVYEIIENFNKKVGKKVVHILTDSISDEGTTMIGIKDLIE